MKSKRLQVKGVLSPEKLLWVSTPRNEVIPPYMLDEKGLPMGRGFSFANTYHGFHILLWQKLRQRLDEVKPGQVVFAIETA